MNVTLLGNSLTAGKIGIAYEAYLNLPADYKIINRGRDGDTVKGLKSRLDNAVQADNPDVLIIQSGANDILLPEMAQRGGKWNIFIDDIQQRGSVPASNGQTFSAAIEDLYSAASAWGIEKIIVTTIPPIGENLRSSRNQKREDYNRRIRDAVNNSAAKLADVAIEFETRLTDMEPHSDWFFDQPGSFTADILRIHREDGAQRISEERGLYFTMDGAHLNEHGAEMMARIIREVILD